MSQPRARGEVVRCGGSDKSVRHEGTSAKDAGAAEFAYIPWMGVTNGAPFFFRSRHPRVMLNSAAPFPTALSASISFRRKALAAARAAGPRAGGLRRAG